MAESLIELLEEKISLLELEKEVLIRERAALAARIHKLEAALRRNAHTSVSRSDPALGPELPNGEGVAGDPPGGEISEGIGGQGAGYQPGSGADPRD
jgi:hypothetical protein